MKRGEIWWAELGLPEGAGPRFRHPVLIVQNDEFLESRLRTTICVVLSSNELLVEAPGNSMLKKEETSLPRDSVVNVSQIITIDKRFLLEKVGKISRERLTLIEKGILLSLGIELIRHSN